MKADSVPDDLESLLKAYGISSKQFEQTAEDIQRLIISTEQV
jgi:hypothetical protein